MRWLHLSDLHYSPNTQNYDTKKMLEKLDERIAELSKKARIDEVFFTGDFRFSKDVESVTARQIAEKLLDIARFAGGDTPARIHIVPGNHDIDLLEDKSKTPLLRSVYTNYKHGAFQGDVIENSTGIPCKDYLLRRLQFYRELASELNDPIWQNSNSLHYCREYGTYKVVYLNTAVACGYLNEAGHLVIGYDELNSSLEQCSHDLPGIALGHHGLGCLAIAERRTITEIFERHNIRLYLCGDAHQGDSAFDDYIVQLTAGGLSLGRNRVEPVFLIGECHEKKVSATFMRINMTSLILGGIIHKLSVKPLHGRFCLLIPWDSHATTSPPL